MSQRDFQTQQEAYNAVKRSLLALKYTQPELDVANAGMDELSNALSESGTVPPNVNPERYAAMVVFMYKKHEDAEQI